MPPDEPTEEERLEELAQDNETPFQPADANADLPPDHPSTDTNIDPMELYDEGASGAAEVEDRSGQSAVTDYDPTADEKL